MRMSLPNSPALVVLLPDRRRFTSTPLPKKIASALGRSQQWLDKTGEIAQLQRHFAIDPLPWSAAALTRQRDAGDAGHSLWLRADPVNVQPDQYSARMMAYGQALSVDKEDVTALLPELHALLAEEGGLLDAPVPSRWYLRLPDELVLPKFTDPTHALGADLFAHLPAGKHGRRWRALLSDSQVLLHQHRHNSRRLAQGKPAINSLWFWGAGRLPQTVSSPYRQVRSPDTLLQALAQQAAIPFNQDDSTPLFTASALIDLRHLSHLQTLIDQALTPLLDALYRDEITVLHLDFADGAQYRICRRQRWKFWAKPVLQLTS